MDRRPAVATRAVAAALLTMGLAACSAPAGATDEEIGRWLHEQADAEQGEGVLGSASARVAASDAPLTASRGEIEMTFDEPVRVERLRLSCLGDGVVDVTAYVTTGTDDGGTRADAFTYEDVPCGTDATEEVLAMGGVRAVGFSASGADRAGAWHALALGQQRG